MNLYKFHDEPKTLDDHDKAHEAVPALIFKKYEANKAELKKRESILAKDPKVAFEYATKVLKKRFRAAEDIIGKDDQYAYRYATVLVNGPFPAGEAAIGKQSNNAFYYAAFILKKRFPAGEAAMKTNADIWRKYQKFLESIK
jgi:hypothetical protein